MNFRNKQGNTPLHEAYQNNKFEMASALEASGLIDYSIKNMQGQTVEDLRKQMEIQMME